MIRALRTFWSRRFFYHWVLIFASCIGLLSGIAALLPGLHFSIALSLVIFSACAIVSALYALGKTAPVHLPVDELAPLALSVEPATLLECTADRGLLAQAHRLAEISYPGVEPLSTGHYEQWLAVNNNILVCLLNNNSEVVGYFDVFPLAENFVDALVNGSVSEHDIRREHILNVVDARSCKRLYLAGFAVAEPETFLGKRYASYLAWGLIMYLRHFYGEPPRQLLAIPSTREGKKLLQRFQFQIIQPADLRRDSLPIYGLPLQGISLEIALANLPNWERATRLGWLRSAVAQQARSA